MYKSKSRSMQRGALVRDSDIVPNVGTYDGTSPVFSKSDAPHFDHGNISKADLVEQLRPLIVSLARNGFRKPIQVAPLLNRFNAKTACGAQWNPRLVWFLLKMVFAEAGAKSSKASREQRKSNDGTFGSSRKGEISPGGTRVKPRWLTAVVVLDSKIGDQELKSAVSRAGAAEIVYVFGSSRDVKRLSESLPQAQVLAVKNSGNRETILLNADIIVHISS